MPLTLNVITASTRPGRIGPSVARWFETFAAGSPFAVTPVDLADFDLPLLDEPAHPRLRQYAHEYTRRWSASVDAADAYVFVTPEYDYFPPAAVVNAIQCLHGEWAYKPAGVVSYGGVSGGLRATQGLRQLLGGLNVHAIPQSVPIPFVTTLLGDDGTFTPNEQITEGAALMLGELHKWAGALEPLRAG